MQESRSSQFHPNNFQFDERLGSGAFGIVYKATLKGTTTRCAVKVMEKLDKNKHIIALKEYKLLEKLSHENVVRLEGGTKENDILGTCSFYLFLEYCNGNFKDRLKDKREHIKHFEWMLQLSSGLAYIHSQRVVHRDLKPENILVKIWAGKECLKISDFGLAKQMDETEHEDGKKLIFPVMYGAPEVISGGHYTTMADVFSFGCICYGMLEGCYEVFENEKHFSAFVFDPTSSQRISLGEALILNRNLKIGVTETGNGNIDTLKELTKNMLKIEPAQRMKAKDVNQCLMKLGATIQTSSARPVVMIEEV